MGPFLHRVLHHPMNMDFVNLEAQHSTLPTLAGHPEGLTCSAVSALHLEKLMAKYEMSGCAHHHKVHSPQALKSKQARQELCRLTTAHKHHHTTSLQELIEDLGGNDDGQAASDVSLDDVAIARGEGHALEQHLGHQLALGLSGALQVFVLLDAVQETLAGVGQAHVLDTDVDGLAKDAATDQLVDLDTDGTARDVEHNTSAAMVESVRHTLLAGTVGDDVNDVTDLDGLGVRAEGDGASLAEGAGEHVARARAVTEAVRPAKLILW